MTSCCSSLSSGSETVVSQVVFKRAPDTLELEEGIHRYGAWDDICKVEIEDWGLSWIWRGEKRERC